MQLNEQINIKIANTMARLLLSERKRNTTFDINKILLHSIEDWTLNVHTCMRTCEYLCMCEWGWYCVRHTLKRKRTEFVFGRLDFYLLAFVRSRQIVDERPIRFGRCLRAVSRDINKPILMLKNQTHQIVKTIKWCLFADDIYFWSVWLIR